MPAQHTECRVAIKACLTGQFSIPDDLQLVSCVYWLSCPQKFLKPVTLEIEHCASLQDSSQFSSLRFIAANSSQEKLPYQFRVLEQGTFVHSYGSIQVSQFSFYGISILKRIWTNWSPTYYSRLHYIQKSVNTWDVDYVVMLHLQAALTVSQCIVLCSWLVTLYMFCCILLNNTGNLHLDSRLPLSGCRQLKVNTLVWVQHMDLVLKFSLKVTLFVWRLMKMVFVCRMAGKFYHL